MRLKDMLLCIEYWNPGEMFLRREILHLQEFISNCSEEKMQNAYISSVFVPKNYEEILGWMRLQKKEEGLKINIMLTDKAAVGIAWLFLKHTDIEAYLHWLIFHGYESAGKAVAKAFKLEHSFRTLTA